MEFMIPRGFLRYRDQNSSSGRKDRQQNICITTVIVTSHQHILMKNNVPFYAVRAEGEDIVSFRLEPDAYGKYIVLTE